jgi:hypothetical protein
VLAEEVGASLLMLEREPTAAVVFEYRVSEALIFARRLRSQVDERLSARA